MMQSIRVGAGVGAGVSLWVGIAVTMLWVGIAVTMLSAGIAVTMLWVGIADPMSKWLRACSKHTPKLDRYFFGMIDIIIIHVNSNKILGTS